MVIFASFPLKAPDQKGPIIEQPIDTASKQAANQNLSVQNSFSSCQDGQKKSMDDRTMPNRPYLHGAHQFLLRSSAISIHDPSNLAMIGALIFVSILMSFILLSLFQR